jgi:glycosyltransferase involved in cell wall biosynthesis
MTTPEAIHQVTAVFADRDAVGGHVVEMQSALRDLGFACEIFAASTNSDRVTARSLTELDDVCAARPSWLLYHCSTYSVAGEAVRCRREPLIVNYHNITPPEFFERWERHVADELHAGRRQLHALAPRTRFAIADSPMNEQELRVAGFTRTAVVPCLIDTGRLGRSSDAPWPGAGGTRWLFVGRLCPNKAQHQVIKAFSVYRRVFDRRAALVLVGTSSSSRYEGALRRLVEELDLDDSVRLPGSVPDDELGAYYRSADVFVCLSEHEGFCNTVVEAMANDLPVIAYARAAVPVTVGDGGLVIERNHPTYVATTVHRLVQDEHLRQALVAAGRARASELDLGQARLRLRDVLSGIVAA